MTSNGGATHGRHIYPHPPIQEVLIQVAMPPGALGSAAVPGQLYDRLRDHYPADVETEIRTQVPVGAAELATAGVRIEQTSRYVLTGREANQKLILGSDRLSVNALPEYEGWQSLLARFTTAADALFDARAELEATAVSIRYINRIVVPEPVVNTDDYFAISVPTAGEGTAPFSAFSIRVRSVLTDDPITCTTSFSFGGADDSGIAFLLDIELTRPLGDADPRQPASWLGILEDLHARENREFESLITDRCRELFES